MLLLATACDTQITNPTTSPFPLTASTMALTQPRIFTFIKGQSKGDKSMKELVRVWGQLQLPEITQLSLLRSCACMPA
jgi:hypothetical protein